MYPHDALSRKIFNNKYKDTNAVYFFLNKKNYKAHHLLIKNKDIALDNIANDVKKKYSKKKIIK